MKLSDKLKGSGVFPFVEDFKKMIGKDIETILKVTSKRLQESKDQKKFLLLTLSDKTGAIRAVDWYNAEMNDGRIKIGDVIMVKGRLVFFDERLQINIHREPESLRILKEEEFSSDRFIAVSETHPDELFAEALRLINFLKDEDLKKLTKSIFFSLEKDIKRAPAGVRIHHAYIGGLLEHSLTVANIANFISKLYGLDKDLMVCGALLHDIGKIREYRIGSSGIEVTTEGELKGHIILGVEIVREYGRKLKIPLEKLLELEHIIASHHGEMELGSPVLPKTPEAMAIHFIENMDSKLARFREIQKKSENGQEWSEYDRNLGRRIFLRNKNQNSQ